jgi:hypothetical protein
MNFEDAAKRGMKNRAAGPSPHSMKGFLCVPFSLSLTLALSTNWISSPLPYSFFNSLTCAFFLGARQQVLLLFFARLPHLIRGFSLHGEARGVLSSAAFCFQAAAFICRHFSPLERANSLQQHFFPVYTAFRSRATWFKRARASREKSDDARGENERSSSA